MLQTLLAWFTLHCNKMPQCKTINLKSQLFCLNYLKETFLDQTNLFFHHSKFNLNFRLHFRNIYIKMKEIPFTGNNFCYQNEQEKKFSIYSA